MKDMLQKLGGSLWALFLALSAVVTVVGAFSMPAFVDVTNPWALLVGAAIVFALGFANGWKQRGFRNVSDAQAKAEMERLERDAQAERERLAAETQARIERENREHEEAMRQRREEREAAKKVEEEGRALREKMRRAATAFKTYDPNTKVMVCRIYDEGRFTLHEDLRKSSDDFAIQVSRLTELESLPDGKYRYTLKPNARAMIDSYPELLTDTRAHIEYKRAASDEEATRANPERMLPRMSIDELQTLQKLVDNDGRLDLNEDHGHVEFDTLQEFGMLHEYYDNLEYAPIYSLDEDVLDFFKQEDNKDLIAMHIAEHIHYEGE